MRVDGASPRAAADAAAAEEAIVAAAARGSPARGERGGRRWTAHNGASPSWGDTMGGEVMSCAAL